MVGIILFVVLALIASYNGDNSGIIAIVKIVGGIALFFVVVSIFAYAPWIFILLIIGIFAWATISDYKSAKCIKDINYQQISSSDNNTLINNYIEHTAFQKELQKNTKTPEEVKSNQISEQIKQMQESAISDYRIIKKELLQQAESGKYTSSNGYKIITYDYKRRFEPEFIGHRLETVYINKTLLNPQGECTNKLTMYISKQACYDAYISEIIKLSKEDGVDITPLMMNTKDRNETYCLPFTVQGFRVCNSNYKFILRANVKY